MTERAPHKEIDPQSTQLWLLRHGPTEWNLRGKIQASKDFDVLPDELPAYFERINISAIPRPDIGIHTPLRRTAQTAQAIFEARGWEYIPLIMNPALTERNWGVFEGLTHAQIKDRFLKDSEMMARHPEIEALENMSSIIDEPDFRVEGSESMREVTDRVRPALLRLREEYPGKKIMIVCHAGVLVSQGLPTKEISRLSVTQDASGEIRLQKVSS